MKVMMMMMMMMMMTMVMMVNIQYILILIIIVSMFKGTAVKRLWVSKDSCSGQSSLRCSSAALAPTAEGGGTRLRWAPHCWLGWWGSGRRGAEAN